MEDETDHHTCGEVDTGGGSYAHRTEPEDGISTVSFGVAEMRTVVDSGRSGGTQPSAARVGESVKPPPIGETVGTWMMSLLVGVASAR